MAATAEAIQSPSTELDLFSAEGFALANRYAEKYADSTLVPIQFQKNPSNCLIAFELAARLRAVGFNVSPMQVMQSMYVVRGKPGWYTTFVIAAINGCGKFDMLDYLMQGNAGSLTRGCIASATHLQSKRLLQGPEVTLEMAKKAGWIDREGSYWRTQPELMLRYRAATLFGRLYVPQILLGMQTVEELHDVIDVTPAKTELVAGVAAAKEMLRQKPAKKD